MAVLGQETLVINSATLGPISGSAPMYAARAWVNFDGFNATIRENGNVSSVTRSTTGTYAINFTTAMPDANYSPTGIAQRTANPLLSGCTIGSNASGTFNILTHNTNNTALDMNIVGVAIFR
jgi:hypothetical protein